jgi:hypothetical protein
METVALMIVLSRDACQWILLPSLTEYNEGVCGAPVEGDSQYCALYQIEMLTFIARNMESEVPSHAVEDLRARAGEYPYRCDGQNRIGTSAAKG